MGLTLQNKLDPEPPNYYYKLNCMAEQQQVVYLIRVTIPVVLGGFILTWNYPSQTETSNP